MKTAFNKNYSKYYDLFYTAKNYSAEAEYISKLIAKHNPEAKNILELGCGTGKHANYLANNYKVTGIDKSKEMIKIAQKSMNKNIKFINSSISGLNIDEKFDVVLSLFHVISYQTTNEELYSTFDTAQKHLKKGGVFIFDFWYGPAVFNEKPSTRIKRVESEEFSVYRLTTPKLFQNENKVEVKFDILLKDKKNKICEEFCEFHNMRYLFIPEINHYFSLNNFKTLAYLKWMKLKDAPDINSWYVVAIGIKE